MSSSVAKPYKFDYLNNKITDDLFFSDDEDNDFNFKYVPASQFKHIVKDVRRQRTKLDEERVWASFVQQQEQDEPDYHVECFHGIYNAKQLLRNNFVEIDQELKRLEEDALPEQTTRLNGFRTVRLDKQQKENLRYINEEPKSPSPRYESEDDDSECSNILLPLPEEKEDNQDPSTFERSRISKLDLKTVTNKSRYENTIRRQVERPLFRELNCLGCNSSPELSSCHDSDPYDLVEIRPHPAVAHKILGIQMKISELLDEILYRLCRIPEPDGDIDLKRRQQRVMEFAIRFSRNYLYDLGRRMTDIQRHVCAISSNARMKATRRGIVLHMQALEQKLCSAHQLLLNALSAYCKHIPSSILKGHPGKLKEILQVVIDLRDVCSKIDLTAEYFDAGDTAPPPLGNDTQKRCYAILSKLRLNSDNESPLYSRSTQSTLIGAPISDAKRRNNRGNNRKTLPNRFSMYSVDSKFSKFQKNRRPVTVGLYPKDRRSLIGRLPFKNPPPTPDQPHPSLATLKSCKDPPRRGRVRTRGYQKEDEIKTMMDMMPTDSEAGSSTLLPRKCHSSMSNGNKMKKRGKLRDKNSIPTTKSSKQSCNNIVGEKKSPKGVAITDEHLSSLIPVIAELMTIIANRQNNSEKPGSISMETFLAALQEYLLSRNKENSHQSFTMPSRHEIDPNRSSEEDNPPKSEQLSSLPKEKEQEISKHIEASRRSSLDHLRQHKETKDCGITQLVVSEASIDRLLNYRDAYQNSCRSSPMYTSNSPNKPWEVVAWIADKLVDELVVEISKELQMDDVIRKLFDMEFQEF